MKLEFKLEFETKDGCEVIDKESFITQGENLLHKMSEQILDEILDEEYFEVKDISLNVVEDD